MKTDDNAILGLFWTTCEQPHIIFL